MAKAMATPGSVKDELLVFGYACKVFRDDERARSLDRGVHLIPWMGDESIRMDRYDGRGHLHDLSEYDAEYTWNRSYDLSEEEVRIEALCDVERYLALTTNLLDEEARHEEEYKRLHQELAEDGAYRAVGFSYGDEYYDPTQPTEEEDAHPKTQPPPAPAVLPAVEKNPEPEVNEEPFIAPEELKLPSGMEVPATFKTHAIVERTAGFVCKQGTQFEIMLKTKQARNSQFDFLRFDHYLNPYYKHILKRMKDGKYTHIPDPKQQQHKAKASGANSADEEEEDDDDDNEGGYLHPSLFASKAQSNSRLEELVKPLTTVDPNHPLMAMALRARMIAAEPADALAQPDKKVKAPPAEPTTPPPLGVDPPVPAGAPNDTGPTTFDADEERTAELAPEQEEEETPPTKASAAAAVAMYYGYYVMPDGTYIQGPPPPAPAADKMSEYAYGAHATTLLAPPPPPGLAPPPLSSSSYLSLPSDATQGTDTTTTANNADTADTASTANTANTSNTANTASAAGTIVVTAASSVGARNSAQPIVTPTADALATSHTAAIPSVIPPPPDVQPVIDKLAQYVAKNGLEFEDGVRSKNDPRFDFLQSWHSYNAYYEFKKNFFVEKHGLPPLTRAPAAQATNGTEQQGSVTSTEPPSATSAAAKAPKAQKITIAPISFAIRAKEPEALPLEKKNALLGDDSDDDDEDFPDPGGGGGSGDVGRAATASPFSASTSKPNGEGGHGRPPAAGRVGPPHGATAATAALEERRPQLSQEEMEAKLAKQRLEDRLSAAAREKLAQAAKESKERQAQAERERQQGLLLAAAALVAAPAASARDERERLLQAERRRKAELFLQKLRYPGDPGGSAKMETEAAGEVSPVLVTPAASALAAAAAAVAAAAAATAATAVATTAAPVPPAPSPAPDEPPESKKARHSGKEKKKEKGEGEEEEERKRRRSRERSRSPRHERGAPRDKGGGRKKKSSRDKKKAKRSKRERRSRSRSAPRSRSRPRSSSRSKQPLPSAYKSARRSRSRSRSVEQRKEDTLPSAYRVSTSPVRSTRRSPKEHKRKRSPRAEGEDDVHRRKKHPQPHPKHHARPSHATNAGVGAAPSSSSSTSSSRKKKRGHSRSAEPSPDASQPSDASSSSAAAATATTTRTHGHATPLVPEKDGTASPTLSAVQVKITQDIMARVKAMLAAEKELP